MDDPTIEGLLRSLGRVETQRQLRRREPALGARVLALKSFQQARLRLTHAELLSHPRQAPAARFFLQELYGPQDFSERDHGLGRVVPTLVRLFPRDVVFTVDRLLQLHALSEELDTAMGRLDLPALPGHGTGGASWCGSTYATAWRLVGRRPEREWQLASVLALGQQMDRLTRLPGLRHSLRLMRGPAHLAGLAPLQGFLERGFDAFRGMGGASDFLSSIQHREALWLEWLFSDRTLVPGVDPPWLGQFP